MGVVRVRLAPQFVISETTNRSLPTGERSALARVLDLDDRLVADALAHLPDQLVLVLRTVTRPGNDEHRKRPRSALADLGFPHIHHVLEDVIHSTDSSTVGQDHVVLQSSIDGLDHAAAPSAGARCADCHRREILRLVPDEHRGEVDEAGADDAVLTGRISGHELDAGEVFVHVQRPELPSEECRQLPPGPVVLEPAVPRRVGHQLRLLRHEVLGACRDPSRRIPEIDGVIENERREDGQVRRIPVQPRKLVSTERGASIARRFASLMW